MDHDNISLRRRQMLLASLGRTALGAAGSLAPFQSAVAQRAYLVEIILFEQPRSPYQNEEMWPDSPGGPSLDGAVELGLGSTGAGTVSSSSFSLVGSSRLGLGGVWSRLDRSESYRPLAHFGWRQPGYSRRSARPAHVVAWSKGQGGRVPVIEGILTLHRARFLHLAIDLLYRPSGSGEIIASNALAGGEGQMYRLEANRTMRPRHLHYIDHPLFGVIVQVS